MSDEIELRVAWAAVAARGAGACGRGRSDEVFDDVVGRHREAHRRYHGVHHVGSVVRHVHRLAEALPGRGSVDVTRAVAAAFFHDAVYDPTASDNEERSALLATRLLATIGWTSDDVAAVAGDIRATGGHLAAGDEEAASDLTRDVLLDADLAVLGSDAATYQAYSTGVRTEYAHVADDAWRVRRADVVRFLLERVPLYATPIAAQWWDHRARANLAAELASLRAPET